MRIGFEATQAMLIDGIDAQHATLKNVLSVCDKYLLTELEAKKIINHQIKILDKHCLSLCAEAKLNRKEQDRLMGHVIKSEFCLQGWSSVIRYE